MAKSISKRLKEAQKLVDKTKAYEIDEAVSILKKAGQTKFDQSVDLNFNLDIDPKQTSQMVRGTVTLPHGSGKKIRVAVFCKGESIKIAEAAGAEFVGGVDLVEKVNQGFLDFDVAISTPEMMRDVGRLGKVLGPKGLMPNPKAGTVTDDIAKAVKEVKAGKIEYKMDKQANINVAVGKISFDQKAISENSLAVIEAILKSKPAATKGRFIKSIAISTTMGPGVKLNLAALKSLEK